MTFFKLIESIWKDHIGTFNSGVMNEIFNSNLPEYTLEDMQRAYNAGYEEGAKSTVTSGEERLSIL